DERTERISLGMRCARARRTTGSYESLLAGASNGDHGGDALRDHSGATEAFHARWLLAPREKLAVLVMSNADSAEPLVASVSTLAMNLMRQAKGVAQE
ncbi:MAG: hypothetical protein KBO59_07820, partial [Achromobacter sp.]|nr:hypothetical protein [Achromobacter sp.]